MTESLCWFLLEDRDERATGREPRAVQRVDQARLALRLAAVADLRVGLTESLGWLCWQPGGACYRNSGAPLGHIDMGARGSRMPEERNLYEQWFPA